MTSWRDVTSQQAQDDLDKLLNLALDFAQQQLNAHREFYPYALAIDLNGKGGMFAVDAGDLDDRLTTDIYQWTLETLIERRKDIRAAALVVDVRVPENDTDAIRVDSEHAEGVAFTVLLPYTKSGPDQPVEISAHAGRRQIWEARDS